MQTTQPRQRGITLVETSVVMAIAAITVSTAAPGFSALIQQRRLDGVAAQLAADLRGARAEAVRRNTGLRVGFHAAAWGSCYVVHTGAADDCSCDAIGPARCSGDARALKTVHLPAADRIALQANVASMRFDPLHGTSTPTATLQVVAASGRAIRHVVNVMGRVRSCSPQGVAPAMPGYPVC